MKSILITLAALAAPAHAQTIPFASPFDPGNPTTMQVQLKVGTQMQPATFTMDTGSVGIVLLASELPPGARQEAPGPIKYTSTGVQWSGFWTTQPVQFMDGHGKVLATANVQVFAAQTPSCIGSGPNACNLAKVKHPFMMGIGFGRPDPYASPSRNPAIHVNGAAEQAYRIDPNGMTLGAPLASLPASCVQQPLKANPKWPGDWMTPTGTLGVGGPAAPANILLDTGITDMLLGVAARPNTGSLTAGTAITVGFLGGKLPLSYTVSATPPAGAPTAYKWIDYYGTNFVNTGITPLAKFVYYFNSTKGVAALCPR